MNSQLDTKIGVSSRGETSPLRISRVISPPLFFANTIVKSKLNHETWHQGIINSWLCYSLLGEALVIPRSLPLADISRLTGRLTCLTPPAVKSWMKAYNTGINAPLGHLHTCECLQYENMHSGVPLSAGFSGWMLQPHVGWAWPSTVSKLFGCSLYWFPLCANSLSL